MRRDPPLRRDLLRWFDRHQRDLPWRHTADPYAIWLSEVMLQQTQVATVIPYWRRFLERFPTVKALARAPLPDVLALWSGLGYYSRARNLHRAAQAVVAEHGGRFPRTAEQLQTLAGFGRYTAGAVASIAFGQPAPLVDGNVARVFSRLFAVEGVPGDRIREAALWRLAETHVPGTRPGAWNQALMELGATVCRPKDPSCLLCPARAHCQALALGRVDQLPPPKVRRAPTRLRLAVAAWRKTGRVLLGRREERGLFGGLWELPTAPLASEAAAGGAFRSRGLDLRIGRPLGLVRRQLTHRNLELHVFDAVGTRVPRRAKGYTEFRWASLAEARHLGMSTAMEKALEMVYGASA